MHRTDELSGQPGLAAAEIGAATQEALAHDPDACTATHSERQGARSGSGQGRVTTGVRGLGGDEGAVIAAGPHPSLEDMPHAADIEEGQGARVRMRTQGMQRARVVHEPAGMAYGGSAAGGGAGQGLEAGGGAVPEPVSEEEEGAVLAGIKPVGVLHMVAPSHHPFDTEQSQRTPQPGSQAQPTEHRIHVGGTSTGKATGAGARKPRLASITHTLAAPTSGQSRVPRVMQVVRHAVEGGRTAMLGFARRVTMAAQALHSGEHTVTPPPAASPSPGAPEVEDQQHHGAVLRDRARTAAGTVKHAIRDTQDAAAEVAGRIMGCDSYGHHYSRAATSDTHAHGGSMAASLERWTHGGHTARGASPSAPAAVHAGSAPASPTPPTINLAHLLRPQSLFPVAEAPAGIAATGTRPPDAAGERVVHVDVPPAATAPIGGSSRRTSSEEVEQSQDVRGSGGAGGERGGSPLAGHRLPHMPQGLRTAGHTLRHPHEAAAEVAGRILGKDNYGHR